MPEKDPIQIIKKNPLPWLVQAVGILVLILNLWLASQLSPIIQDLDSVEGKVVAIQVRNDKADLLVDEFIVVREKMQRIEQDMQEIKVDIREIRNALR